MIADGHAVEADDPEGSWTLDNLLRDRGPTGLDSYRAAYPELSSQTYARAQEAASIGTPLLSARRDGLDAILTPGREILCPDGPEAVLAVLREAPQAERRAVGAAARETVLARHSAAHRSEELEAYLREAAPRQSAATPEPDLEVL